MGAAGPEEYAVRIAELRRLGHELRTPLTLIQGYVSLLEDDVLASEQRREACGLVREKCAEMNRIITAFLDAATEEGHVGVETEAPGLQAAR